MTIAQRFVEPLCTEESTESSGCSKRYTRTCTEVSKGAIPSHKIQDPTHGYVKEPNTYVHWTMMRTCTCFNGLRLLVVMFSFGPGEVEDRYTQVLVW
ncbi:hypothetical protein KQX54_013565 [Cotesia glomerata]|uniref:Uncharacterized protein n=1 Tax=Cotesia glomerata TaxID=32391 RepID=A0AAV7I4N1_COTGL|nr:hypothetical protein KQX54_013565 [Cotesia glomerata]